MKESLKQTLSQKMQQRLSPLQMRFVRMLEMTGPEIEDEVRREIDDNPALEIADVHDPDAGEEVFGESAEEMQLADYRNEDEIPSYRFEARNTSPDDSYFEPVVVADDHTLADSLVQQLAETDMSEPELMVARYVIGNIDDNGYLTRTLSQLLDDLAINAGVEISMDQLRGIVHRIRSLDPPGVCAFDLRDCLALQLKRLPQTEARRLALEIVEHYFDVFSLKHFDKLAAMLGVDMDKLREALAVVRSLNPKPGGIVGDSEAEAKLRHIVPDFNVEVDGNRVTLTLLNNIPDLTIESSFISDGQAFTAGTSEQSRKDAESFITRKRDDATEFIDLLRLRQETLYKVMSAIVRLQHDFFVSEDDTKLRPMILKDVGRETGYDLSVISRATAGKYVATPLGVYPLKFFFNESVGNDDESSTREVLAILKEIVESEDPAHPLSDDALMKLLAGKGYEIARRTVTKYRERLGIPVARLRKEI
ncbi:MAG: RNA polymerase factor sigma-54 [Staphylococcus sp.]|nr:RNA polymerase factor sigma-54 [Staphylococcus sp.]